MQPSFLKRIGLFVARLVLRVFGMKLNNDATLPADEYGAHGAYRTPSPPPATEVSPVKTRPGLLERIRNSFRGLSKELRILVVLTLLGAGVPAVVWGVYAIFVGGVPTAEYMFLTKSGEYARVALPFVVSRLLDIPLLGLWAMLLGLGVSGMKAIDWRNEKRCAAFGYPWVGVGLGVFTTASFMVEGSSCTVGAVALLSMIPALGFGLLSGTLLAITTGFKQGFGAFLIYALPVWLISEIIGGPAAAVVFGLAAVIVGALFLAAMRLLVSVGSDS